MQLPSKLLADYSKIFEIFLLFSFAFTSANCKFYNISSEQVIKLSDQNYVRTLENAIQVGSAKINRVQLQSGYVGHESNSQEMFLVSIWTRTHDLLHVAPARVSELSSQQVNS